MLLAMLAALFSCQAPVGQVAEAPAPTSVAAPAGVTPAATGTGVEVLDLGNDCSIQGRVLRSTEQMLFVDVGYDILKVPVAAVLRRSNVDGTRSGGIVHEKLWAR